MSGPFLDQSPYYDNASLLSAKTPNLTHFFKISNTLTLLLCFSESQILRLVSIYYLLLCLWKVVTKLISNSSLLVSNTCTCLLESQILRRWLQNSFLNFFFHYAHMSLGKSNFETVVAKLISKYFLLTCTYVSWKVQF